MLKLKLTHRSPKQPIRGLREFVELPQDATVEDAKKAVASQGRISDYNRIGLYDPRTREILKNRRALIRDEANVISAGELVVKDLGTLSDPPRRRCRHLGAAAPVSLTGQQAPKWDGVPSM